jgi:hypothetical protein
MNYWIRTLLRAGHLAPQIRKSRRRHGLSIREVIDEVERRALEGFPGWRT